MLPCLLISLINLLVFTVLVAKEACDQGKNPIVVDNTNTQAWEMEYYVSLVRSSCVKNKALLN